MPALSSERKLARRLGELFSPSFDVSEFVGVIFLMDMWIRKKFLAVVQEFVDHGAERWYLETCEPGEEDFYRDCARISEAMNAYRFH